MKGSSLFEAKYLSIVKRQLSRGSQQVSHPAPETDIRDGFVELSYKDTVLAGGVHLPCLDRLQTISDTSQCLMSVSTSVNLQTSLRSDCSAHELR